MSSASRFQAAAERQGSRASDPLERAGRSGERPVGRPDREVGREPARAAPDREIGRELASALTTARSGLELYRLALRRAVPLVGADFGSVFLRDPEDPELLKLACAHNWPQSSALHLGRLRVRVGRGPTGRAVADGAAIEVANVFSESALQEWWEPARELGFTSMISLPLGRGDAVAGALSFYFAEPRHFPEEDRRVLCLVADLLAAAAEALPGSSSSSSRRGDADEAGPHGGVAPPRGAD